MNINNISRQFNRIATCLLISFLVFVVFLALTPRVAEAALQIGSSWELSKGKPKCGGIVNGKLQATCEKLAAKKESKAVGKCPKGSFFDIGTWSCFTCPSDYKRTGFHVEKEKACSRNIKDEFTKATYVKKLQCPSGSKYYPLKNGECWSCPTGYGRTAAAVDKWNACGKIGKKAVSASFKGRACGEEGFADPRKGGECWSCPEGAHRTGTAVTGVKACVKTEEFKSANKEASLSCPAGQVFDFIDGGTCWSCPTGYKRSLSSVKSKTACKSNQMVWEPPTPTMPGLFGINGAEAVLTELIKEQTQINTTIESMAKGIKGDPAAWKQEAWNLIKTEPWKSPILATVVLNRAAEVARKPASKRSQTEKDLLKSVSNQIQKHRLFVANQTKQAFDNALATDAKTIEQRNEGGMQALFGGIATAPDYNQLTQAALGAGGAAVMAGGMSAIFFNPAAYNALFPFREAARRAAIEAGKKVVTQVAKSAGSKALSSLSTFASVSAGPLIIITGAVLIAQMELDKILQTEETEGKIRQAIDQASEPLDLPVFLEQKDAMQIIMSHWGALMAGTTQPSQAFNDELKKIDVDAGDQGTDHTGATGTAYTAAITLKNGNTYLFGADGTYSRSKKGINKGFDKGYPKKMFGGWKGFPKTWYKGINAGIARNGEIPYMWKDGQYARLTGVKVDKGYPKKMPGGWKKMPKAWAGNVDAAFYYPPVKRHYLFKGNQYVRLNDVTVEKGYPKKLPGGWKGMPANFAKGIDAATYRDSHVYMIKGDEYIRFTKTTMDKGYPKKIKGNWPE
jgi:Hemopexin